MKITRVFLLVSFLCLIACEQERLTEITIQPDLSLSSPIEPLNGQSPLNRAKINRVVESYLFERDEFRWEYVDDHTLWSAVIASDTVVSLGYTVAGFQNLGQRIHELDINSPNWRAVRDALVEFVLIEENIGREESLLEKEDILAFGEKPLPYINLKISRYETLAKLRRMKVVRYVEPMGYGIDEEFGTRSSKGCNGDPENINSNDYSTISPGSKLSWNYPLANIPQAWAYSQGDNVSIGLIDTGIGPRQDKLNSEFDDDQSTNRSIEKYGTFVTGWWWWARVDGPDDDCGHGTGMAGIIAGPRNDEGASVGVAYRSNLVSVRATDDVVINESREKDGVSDAYYYLGSRSDIKIISMSLGDIFYSGQVADAIQYAYNRGKMIFSAAGTSLTWTNWVGVVFPATLDETIAVTGVTTSSNLKRCNTCHSGSKVDFVLTIQDANNSDRNPITLALEGNQPRYTGGSSSATAASAGIAALVWSINPSFTRAQVYQRLKESSSAYPNRTSSYGYGRIDALKAVDPGL